MGTPYPQIKITVETKQATRAFIKLRWTLIYIRICLWYKTQLKRLKDLFK